MSGHVLAAIAIATLVAVAAILSLAEVALLRVPRVSVEVRAEAGDVAAIRLSRLLKRLPEVLNVVLLAVLAVQITTAALLGTLVQAWFGDLWVTLTSVLLTVVLFVYAEAIPKTVAVRAPLPTALVLSRPIAVLDRLGRPLVSLLVRFADLQTPGRGITMTSVVTEEELRRLAAEAAAAGRIEPSDAELIERSFDLGDLAVAEIVVPRPDIVSAEVGATVAATQALMLCSGHDRLPVRDGDLDHIVGVAHLSDVVAAVAHDPGAPTGSIARSVIVVPEIASVSRLLREMQRTGSHVALAVDEYGSTAGMLTIEDVVSELVGEITRAADDAPEVVAVERGWLVEASTRVADLEDRIGAPLPHGAWTSIGGLVINLMGDIPEVGDAVNAAGFRFLVTERAGHRIQRVEVRPAAAPGHLPGKDEHA